MEEPETGRKPRSLTVQRGLVLPPRVLRAILPDVATVLNNATSASTKQPARLKISNPRPPVRDSETTKAPRNTKQILNPFPCNICSQRFPTRNTLNIHLLEHINQCKNCNATFDSKILLLKHICCICCKKTYQSELELNQHRCWLSKSGIQIYKNKLTNNLVDKSLIRCVICRLKFTNKTALIEHKNIMKIPCIKCQKCYKTLDEHIVEHNKLFSQSAFLCKHCGECFEESLSYTSHVRTHVPVKSYQARKLVKLQTTKDKIEITKSPSGDTLGLNKQDGEAVIDVKQCDDTRNSEMECDIKIEPEEFELVSREAASTLYEGHEVQGEMVLGPEQLQRDGFYTLSKAVKTSKIKQEFAADPLSTSEELWPVKLEPSVSDEETHTVDSNSLTNIKTEDIV